MTSSQDVRRLKYAVEACVNGVWGDEPNGETDMVVVRVADFDRSKGVASLGDSPTVRAIPESARNRRVLRPGDLLIEKSGGGEQQPVGNVVLFTDDRPAVCSNFVARMPVIADCDSRFVGYVFRALYAEGRNIPHIKQTSGIQNLDSESYLNELAWLPARSEQERIANFLDEQTSRIDALIAQKQKLVEKLAEWWSSTVAYETGCADVRVSGDWTPIALKHVTIARCDGPFGSALASAHYVDSGARVVRLQNIRFGEFDDSDVAYIDEDYFKRELTYHSVLEGDVLIAGLGDERNLVGRACVAPKLGGNALVKADCFRFRLDTQRALPEFVALQLSALAAKDGGELATGSTRQRIPLTTTESRKLRLPALSTQRAVVETLAAQKLKHEELVRHTSDHIDHLREYRSSLISAAVTGQLSLC